MLPAVRNTVTAAVAALAVVAAPASQAQAFGKNERNFLLGVATTLVVTEVIKSSKARTRPAPRYYYVEPQPVRAPSYPAPVVQGTAASQAFYGYAPAERRAIQSRLRAMGYYTGAIDGTWGPRTSAALRAYALDYGLGADLGTYRGSVAVMNRLIG